MKIALSIFVLLSLLLSPALAETTQVVTVGIATVLTGDAAIIGSNIQKTVETYRRHRLRHPIKFIFEDARKSSSDGLTAYRKLINLDRVDVIIGATTSNGTLAGAALVNRSRTVLLTPLTGGLNIDRAGPYIFRVGNSDILNGYQQADLFLSRGFKNVALITEQTEYTTDIAEHFKRRFTEKGGQITLHEEFLPDSTDFRSLILKIKASKPQALFMSTQTGLAFGLFLKQFSQIAADQKIEIHTNFLSADNPDARQAAGDAIYGVHYMAPAYDRANPKLVQFVEEFKQDHGAEPSITFHTAGTVDSLDMLQAYLDGSSSFSREGFHDYLLKQIKNYQGLMGTYSFDSEGNADIGFTPQIIERKGA